MGASTTLDHDNIIPTDETLECTEEEQAFAAMRASCSNRRQSAATRRFHTHMGMALAAVSLLLLGLLSVLNNYNYMPLDNFRGDEHVLRLLEQDLQQQNDNNNDDGGGGGGGGNTDYTSYSCHDLYTVTPDHGADQCAFAQHCNNGQGLWSSWVFCRSVKPTVWVTALGPFLVVWLVLLFRMLGSTAEDFFSPALEMFSTKLGLPPRFAGVSLLALGNGAADVSATISAISADPVHGYQLSLGALTGAAMVIGSVVSAVVVITAGGVPCRGALVRDVAALAVAVGIVWNQFASRGSVGPDTVTLFLSVYCGFVVLVLLADIYHRAVVLPRLRNLERHRELVRQHQHGLEAHHALGGDVDSPRLPPPEASGRLDRFVTALSNYDNSTRRSGDNNNTDEEPGSWQGVESEDVVHDRPLVLHGANGILTHNHHQHHANNNNNGTDAVPSVAASPDTAATNYNLLQDEGLLADAAAAAAAAENPTVCVEPGTLGLPAMSWPDAIRGAGAEIAQHFGSEWEDIWYNGDLDVITRFLLVCEFPFWVLRKITVAIPCEGFYVRALVALTLFLSMPWLALYMWSNNNTNIIGVIFAIVWTALAIVAGVVLRFAPATTPPIPTASAASPASSRGGDDSSPEMVLWAATPIALFGFAVGATWIDAIANSLVAVLDFVGICLRIPGPVVGLTVLAWGNSMSDLSANVTMARKGLANMAMTASFAGPLFNILMGLGLGFSSLMARGDRGTEFSVTLDSSVKVGFLFIILNSVTIIVFGLWFGRGTIPKKYGYVALILYTLYLVTALVMQYA